MSRFLGLTLFLVLFQATTIFAQTSAKPIGIGVAAPDFTLVNQDGRPVTLSDSKGKYPVVLVFYRGYW
jgi:cytochrome oxidase Cu insertion factor (SCO1/SenC/PrrC family)